MGSFEKSFLETSIEEAKKKREESFSEPEVEVEKGEENDFHGALRRELREKQSGGVDIHFSQIDVDRLSTKALDLYEEYKKKKVDFEKDLKNHMAVVPEGSDDYNFSAMLLNWHMRYISDKRHKEREERKKLKLAA